MTTPDATFEHAVVGAGRRGLLAALRLRQSAAPESVVLIEAQPRPGGDDLTRRSNGFVCELGAFALGAAELAPFLAALRSPPHPIPVAAAARTGELWTGRDRVPAPVGGDPQSFRSGLEELWQACRRELEPALRLGRAATAVQRTRDGWTLTLGGEVPATLAARTLHLALPLDTSSRLCATFDPGLAAAAGLLATETGALVFLGDRTERGESVPGYGIAAAPGVPGRLREVIHCSRALPGRAIPGRCLLRCELTGVDAAATDAGLQALAEDELARWLGAPLGPFGFALVHRTAALVRDGAFAECSARLRGLSARAGALHVL